MSEVKIYVNGEWQLLSDAKIYANGAFRSLLGEKIYANGQWYEFEEESVSPTPQYRNYIQVSGPFYAKMYYEEGNNRWIDYNNGWLLGGDYRWTLSEFALLGTHYYVLADEEINGNNYLGTKTWTHFEEQFGGSIGATGPTQITLTLYREQI